ncbi:hypothetical protein [Protaetiibacter mangrovi]|uniref:Asparagine synthase n=1 Tax=Protaetiibacter mangrovi TaxID=2970926 RepID=A0ABT1ZCR2_9MICO|nr:hypothetical protein [Protaetiibacter mangrovi]MCS0498466.1 hypothetical protein [Protaetiibacter mangrovi]TPW98944.1 hypothetical protein FJ656_33340 [Schumannella luteola]
MPRHPRRSEMVADATLVSVAAARQAAKNLMLVRALRDAADFDHDWYMAAVRREFEVLAVEADANAARVLRIRAKAGRRHGHALSADDYRAADTRRLKKRARVLTDLAEELRRLSTDDETIATLIDEARIQALDEITATTAAVPGLGRTKPAKGVARSKALQALREELSDYAD